MYKGRRLRRRRGGLAIFLGAVLILAALVMVAMDLRNPGETSSAPAPGSNELELTVPDMKRVESVPVRTATTSNGEKLDAGAIRLQSSGLPWESGSNVYIAGHRLGYPGTGSFMLFYDINKLEEGDRVVLEDSGGREYVYRVFRELVVGPNETRVTQPVAGRSVVSLQSCTLPNYTERLIVQAELVETRTTEPAQANAGSNAG